LRVQPQICDLTNQVGGAVRFHPSLLFFTSDIHLDQDGRRLAYAFDPRLCQRNPVDRMQEVGAGPDCPGFVRLKGTDKMPSNVVWQLRHLFGHLTGAVLPEVAVPLRVQGFDLTNRPSL
jgi:hypothetical protein